MDYDYNKLRGRIVEKCGTIDNFAQKLNVSRTTVSNKLNNHCAVSQEDMNTWGDILELTPAEYGVFFCTPSCGVLNDVKGN